MTITLTDATSVLQSNLRQIQEACSTPNDQVTIEGCTFSPARVQINDRIYDVLDGAARIPAINDSFRVTHIAWHDETTETFHIYNIVSQPINETNALYNTALYLTIQKLSFLVKQKILNQPVITPLSNGQVIEASIHKLVINATVYTLPRDLNSAYKALNAPCQKRVLLASALMNGVVEPLGWYKTFFIIPETPRNSPVTPLLSPVPEISNESDTSSDSETEEIPLPPINTYDIWYDKFFQLNGWEEGRLILKVSLWTLSLLTFGLLHIVTYIASTYYDLPRQQCHNSHTT